MSTAGKKPSTKADAIADEVTKEFKDEGTGDPIKVKLKDKVSTDDTTDAPKLEDSSDDEKVEEVPEKIVRSEMVISREFRDQGKVVDEEQEEKVLRIHKFVTIPAMVTVRYGLTMNLGNYESARVDVEVTVPCYKEELEEGYAEAVTFVEEKINKEVHEIRNPDKSDDDDDESGI